MLREREVVGKLPSSGPKVSAAIGIRTNLRYRLRQRRHVTLRDEHTVSVMAHDLGDASDVEGNNRSPGR